MCIGVPVTIVELRGQAARCIDADGGERSVDLSLLGEKPAVGDALLVHVNVALRTLGAEEARRIADALEAVTAAASGRPFEHLIADLVDREPQLPPHLREPQQSATGDTPEHGQHRR